MGGKWSLSLAGALTLVAVFISGCSEKPPAYNNAPSFSADFLLNFKDASKQQKVDPSNQQVYKLNISGTKVRLEMVKPGTGVSIIRKDLGVIWTLMSADKLFLEMPIKPKNKNPLVFKPEKTVDYEKLGEDTLDGQTVLKERIAIQNGKEKEREFYRWFDTGLGWPVKIESLDGKWSMRLTDIVPGPQDPSLFEIPQGYRAIAPRKRPIPKAGPH